MSPAPVPSAPDAFAKHSRIAVLAIGYPLGALALWALVTGRTALGVGVLVAIALLVLARGMMLVVRGRRALAAGRATAEVPVRVVATPANPSPVDSVVPELLALNSDTLPYRVDAARTPDGVVVEVRWKSEEQRWQTLFTRGGVFYAWRMELRLDPRTAQYRFTEYSASARASAVVGPGAPHAQADWKWKKGKTAISQSESYREGAEGELIVAAGISPGDAKRPVFTVLRNHGWRPPRDWFGARLFER